MKFHAMDCHFTDFRITDKQNVGYAVKALLHYAIFSATCLAVVENLVLQVAEVWC